MLRIQENDGSQSNKSCFQGQLLYITSWNTKLKNDKCTRLYLLRWNLAGRIPEVSHAMRKVKKIGRQMTKSLRKGRQKSWIRRRREMEIAAVLSTSSNLYWELSLMETIKESSNSPIHVQQHPTERCTHHHKEQFEQPTVTMDLPFMLAGETTQMDTNP